MGSGLIWGGRTLQQVPGVGFNDVVIETPWHNMCAALEKEEPLGSQKRLSQQKEGDVLALTALSVETVVACQASLDGAAFKLKAHLPHAAGHRHPGQRADAESFGSLRVRIVDGSSIVCVFMAPFGEALHCHSHRFHARHFMRLVASCF